MPPGLRARVGGRLTAFDEAQFDRYAPGTQPVMQAQNHSPIWVTRAYDATTDNGGVAIVDPHDGVTITAAMMALVGVTGGRLVPLVGTGSFEISHLTSATGVTPTVQIWRVHPTPGGIWATRGAGGGLPLGVLENAIRDADAASTLVLDQGPDTPPRSFFSVGSGGELVMNVPSTGTQVYMGNWTTFLARGASHVLVTVTARSAGSSAVIIKTY